MWLSLKLTLYDESSPPGGNARAALLSWSDLAVVLSIILQDDILNLEIVFTKGRVSNEGVSAEDFGQDFRNFQSTEFLLTCFSSKWEGLVRNSFAK